MRLPVLLMISSMRGGGSERQTLLLLKHLDRDRFVPHLYLTERAGDLLVDVPSDVVIHSFQDSAPRSGIYYPGRVLSQQIQHLRDVCQRESIAAIYDRTFLMTLIAGPAAAQLGVGRVSTIVSPPHLALPLVEQRFVGMKRRRLARAYRNSRAVIAVSGQAADSARRYYELADDSVRVIANPVDVAMLGEAATEPAPPRDHRLTVVCVGRMTAEKGHRDLLSAIALTQSELPEDSQPAKFWLIGTGDDQIEAVAASLARHPEQVRNATVFHLAGRHPASILEKLQLHGCSIASVHPVRSLGGAVLSRADFAGTACLAATMIVLGRFGKTAAP